MKTFGLASACCSRLQARGCPVARRQAAFVRKELQDVSRADGWYSPAAMLKMMATLPTLDQLQAASCQQDSVIKVLDERDPPRRCHVIHGQADTRGNGGGGEVHLRWP
jgi:hypothetical protein